MLYLVFLARVLAYLLIYIFSNMNIICVKDLVSISGAKFYPIISIVKYIIVFKK